MQFSNLSMIILDDWRGYDRLSLSVLQNLKYYGKMIDFLG